MILAMFLLERHSLIVLLLELGAFLPLGVKVPSLAFFTCGYASDTKGLWEKRRGESENPYLYLERLSSLGLSGKIENPKAHPVLSEDFLPCRAAVSLPISD